MRLFDIRPPYPALWLALLAGLMLSAGCRTATQSPWSSATSPTQGDGAALLTRTATQLPLFTASGPGWRVQEGQALWRPRRGYPEIGGDVVVATHEDGRCLIEFAKTPMTLVMAQTTGTNWLIQFPPARMSFRGHQQPPTHFGWLYLHAALSGQPLPAPFRFEREPAGGWRLENPHSGETLSGFLAP